MAVISPHRYEYIGDGFTRQFPILFDYIYPEEIQVLVQGVLQEYLIDSGTVRLAVVPSAGSKVTVQRNTDARNPAHRFAHGSPLLPAYLDANFRQALHAVQEAITDAADNTEIARAELQLAVGALELMDVQLQDQIDLLAKEDNLQQEIQARKDADAILQGQIYLRATVVQLNQEIRARQAADAHLQAQISAAEPLEASAFSPISWHDQLVETSVTIPPNKNAWSFGPTMTIAEGQAVTVSEGSFWTIANGEVQQ